MLQKFQTQEQARFLSQAIQLEEAVNPLLQRVTIWVISCSVLLFIAWSAVTHIHEVARASGEVVPEGLPRVVQHLEGGIVEKILVKEGDTVNKGQELVYLNGAGSSEDLQRARSKQVSLMMQEERLRAFLEKRQPNFKKIEGINSASIKDDASIQDQTQFFSDMQQAHTQELQVLDQQISQRRRLLKGINSELALNRSNLELARQVLSRRQVLAQEGYTSSIRLMETQQNVNSLEGQVMQLQQRAAATQDEIVEFEKRHTLMTSQANDQTNERLDLLLNEKAQNAEMIDKLSQRVGRLTVTAPASGRVQGITVNTQGAIVTPGQTLMEIIPNDQKLLVQVKIAPKDIGHIALHQRVHVKLSSYDFARYGTVEGNLTQLSATTFTGQQGERYYQGLIKLDSDYVGQNASAPVLPGMTVMADIVTGQKTVLQYLFKPINNAMKTAFSER